MKKYGKYIVLFFVAYVAINISIKFYTASQWKENPRAIEALIKHCTKNTKSQFDTFNIAIEQEAKSFIMTGKEFTEIEKPYKEFYKRCISGAIYYYSPQEYFSGSKISH